MRDGERGPHRLSFFLSLRAVGSPSPAPRGTRGTVRNALSGVRRGASLLAPAVDVVGKLDNLARLSDAPRQRSVPRLLTGSFEHVLELRRRGRPRRGAECRVVFQFPGDYPVQVGAG